MRRIKPAFSSPTVITATVLCSYYETLSALLMHFKSQNRRRYCDRARLNKERTLILLSLTWKHFGRLSLNQARRVDAATAAPMVGHPDIQTPPDSKSLFGQLVPILKLTQSIAARCHHAARQLQTSFSLVQSGHEKRCERNPRAIDGGMRHRNMCKASKKTPNITEERISPPSHHHPTPWPVPFIGDYREREEQRVKMGNCDTESERARMSKAETRRFCSPLLSADITA